MSYVTTLKPYLDEESFRRLLNEARGRKLSVEFLIAECLREHLAEMSGAEEALKRLDDPRPVLSLDDMQRRLAS